MTATEFVRVKPGKPLEGISYFHVDIQLGCQWHTIRTCADKSDAVKIADYLEKLVAQEKRRR